MSYVPQTSFFSRVTKTDRSNVSSSGGDLENSMWSCLTSGNPPTLSTITVCVFLLPSLHILQVSKNPSKAMQSLCLGAPFLFSANANHMSIKLHSLGKTFQRWVGRHTQSIVCPAQVHSSSLTFWTIRTSGRLWSTITSAGWFTTQLCCPLWGSTTWPWLKRSTSQVDTSVTRVP